MSISKLVTKIKNRRRYSRERASPSLGGDSIHCSFHSLRPREMEEWTHTVASCSSLFFCAARIKRNLGKTEKNRKTRNEHAPLLGGDIEKLIGFMSIGCSRQKFGCLQKILRCSLDRRLQITIYGDYWFCCW